MFSRYTVGVLCDYGIVGNAKLVDIISWCSQSVEGVQFDELKILPPKCFRVLFLSEGRLEGEVNR